jgi:hypothetical protein
MFVSFNEDDRRRGYSRVYIGACEFLTVPGFRLPCPPIGPSATRRAASDVA